MSGFVQIYALLTPYLYLFIPHERREPGAKLLVWIWAPAIIVGVMTAYTSAAGYVSSAVGFAPAMIVGGLFLAWSLEAVTKDRIPWLALAALVAIAAVTVSFNFQYQSRDIPYAQLTSRFDWAWWCIKVTPGRRQQMDGFGATSRRRPRPADKLLVFWEGSGYYLYWNGEFASNTYWAGPDLKTGDLAPEHDRLLATASPGADGRRAPARVRRHERRGPRGGRRLARLSGCGDAARVRHLAQASGREHERRAGTAAASRQVP